MKRNWQKLILPRVYNGLSTTIFCVTRRLFLLFVNDLPRWIVNSMKMFADDTKLLCRNETKSDSESLQKDLDSLANWSQK